MHKLEQKIVKRPSLKVRTVCLYVSEKGSIMQAVYNLLTAYTHLE
jgi:hypothetical protein